MIFTSQNSNSLIDGLQIFSSVDSKKQNEKRLSRTEVMNRYVRSIFQAVRYGKLHVGAPQTRLTGRAAIMRRLYGTKVEQEIRGKLLINGMHLIHMQCPVKDHYVETFLANFYT